MAKFFIDRPVFAWVISIIIMLAGTLSIVKLPVAQYPDIAPPAVSIRATYPGASAQTVQDTVIQIIEQGLTGIDNVQYMSSTSDSSGIGEVTVTFLAGTDPDIAQVQVQNKLQTSMPLLPQEVQQQGVRVTKSSAGFLMVIGFVSADNSMDKYDIADYVAANVQDQLSRVNGVGQITLFGSQYAMRIWLDADKLATYGLVTSDITDAIRAQNAQIAAGELGGAPAVPGQEINSSIVVQTRLSTPEEFGNILLRVNQDGSQIRLKNVARVELGGENYSFETEYNDQAAAGMAITLASGANALDTANAVRERINELSEFFPPNLEIVYPYDTTPFVKLSINAVVHTLIEAIILVFFVMYLFLQNFRATLIPTIAVPVVLLGTFAVLSAFGFSINTLTMFAMVLAIGLLVDDAIVVVENVERNIEEGLSPLAATYKAMQEVSGPIIAISLTLVAVFVPIAFVSGLTGQFYKQFALTIAISTVISAINSLTLSPALAALLLKSHDAPKDRLTRIMDKVFGRFFGWFNRSFTRSSGSYSTSIGKLLGRKGLTVGVYVILLGVIGIGFNTIPKGFVPPQDKQYLIGFAQLPDGATLDRTQAVIREMGEIGLAEEGVEAAVQFPGLSINGFTNSSSAGIVFLTLDAFDQRTGDELSASAIAQKLQMKYAGIEEAFIAIFPPPPVRGLGTTGGFKLQIEDRAGLGYEKLAEVVAQVQQKAWQTPELTGVYSNYKINVPQLFADVDRTKAKQLGLNVKDVFDTMQVYLGSLYVNDFNQFGRTYQVIAQADAEFRNTASDALNLKVRNVNGDMVPLGSVLSMEESYGPESATHYNGYLAADLNGNAAPGYSSGQAQDAISKILAETLPPGMVFEWTDLTYQQVLSGNTAFIIFPLCLLLVFLVLAAQYESLALPLVVISIVPLSILAALFGVWVTNGDNNIFTQISLFVLAGLASKNAILIVEFARELEQRGMETYQAAITASRMRLRPILMTSFAFIMGVLPMVFSSGAGAEMRNVMGIAVFSGMLGVTFFGLFFTPIFYVLLRRLEGNRSYLIEDKELDPAQLPAAPKKEIHA